VTFWPRDSNVVFKGKIAKLCAFIKSTIFIVGVSKFGIGHFKRYTFKLCRKKIRFIDTLSDFFISFYYYLATQNKLQAE